MNRVRGALDGASKSNVPKQEAAVAIATEALSYLAADPEQMARFLALTGIDAGAIRTAAREPGFLAGVLDYLCGDERLLIAVAARTGVPPVEIETARQTLGGNPWERDVP